MPNDRTPNPWAALLLAAVVVAAPSPGQARRQEEPPAGGVTAPPAGGGEAIQDRIARALGYTVTIEGDGVYGSGVLVSPGRGLVVTNEHVVREMRRPRVSFHDGSTAVAQLLESDRQLDLALLQVPPQAARPTPSWADPAALRPGDELFAVGCPRHLAFTVSRGIVSFTGRPVEGTRFVQTDLPINDGNSGGPVINGRGELVGLMTFVLKRSQGLSFALPIQYALERFRTRLGPQISTAAALDDRWRRWRR